MFTSATPHREGTTEGGRRHSTQHATATLAHQPLDWRPGVTLKAPTSSGARLRRVEILVDSGVHLPEAGLTLGVRGADLKEPLLLALKEHATLVRAPDMPPGRPQTEENEP